MITINIPNKLDTNKYSAMLSMRYSRVRLFVRSDIKENKQEKIRINAITDVNSSMKLDSA